MDATELARWTRFANKGGIGKCTALQDCIAESEGDLMFLKDDEITVLMQLNGKGDHYLGYCEGVVGRFHGTHVRFHSKLKIPVMTKRSSSGHSSSPSLGSGLHQHGGVNGSGSGIHALSPLPSPARPGASFETIRIPVPLFGLGKGAVDGDGEANSGSSVAGTLASAAADMVPPASSSTTSTSTSTSALALASTSTFGNADQAHTPTLDRKDSERSVSEHQSVSETTATTEQRMELEPVASTSTSVPTSTSLVASDLTMTKSSSSASSNLVSVSPFSSTSGTSASASTESSTPPSVSVEDNNNNVHNNNVPTSQPSSPTARANSKDRAKRRTGIIGGALPPLPLNFASVSGTSASTGARDAGSVVSGDTSAGDGSLFSPPPPHPPAPATPTTTTTTATPGYPPVNSTPMLAFATSVLSSSSSSSSSSTAPAPDAPTPSTSKLTPAPISSSSTPSSLQPRPSTSNPAHPDTDTDESTHSGADIDSDNEPMQPPPPILRGRSDSRSSVESTKSQGEGVWWGVSSMVAAAVRRTLGSRPSTPQTQVQVQTQGLSGSSSVNTSPVKQKGVVQVQVQVQTTVQVDEVESGSTGGLQVQTQGQAPSSPAMSSTHLRPHSPLGTSQPPTPTSPTSPSPLATNVTTVPIDDAVSERSSLYSTNTNTTHETESVVTHDSLFHFDNPSPKRKATTGTTDTAETAKEGGSSGEERSIGGRSESGSPDTGTSGGAGLDIGLTMLMGDASDDESESEEGFGFTSLKNVAKQFESSGARNSDDGGLAVGTPKSASAIAMKHESVSSFYPESSTSVSLYEDDGDGDEEGDGEGNRTLEVDDKELRTLATNDGVASSSDTNGATVPRTASPEPMGTNAFNRNLDSDDEEDDFEGEWDGADIYDQYRYSRFSMASKMSRFSVSTVSKFSSGSESVLPPPVPSRGSGDSLQSLTHSAQSKVGGSPRSPLSPGFANIMPLNINKARGPGEGSMVPSSPLKTSYTNANGDTVGTLEPTVTVTSGSSLGSPTLSPPPTAGTLRPNALDRRTRPAPLNTAAASASPLLTTSFSSPTTSHSPALSPLLSPAPSISSNSSRSPVIGGAASALRQKLEGERGLPSPGLVPLPSEVSGGRGKDVIVVGDESGGGNVADDGGDDGDGAVSIVSTSPGSSPVRGEHDDVGGREEERGLARRDTNATIHASSSREQVSVGEVGRSQTGTPALPGTPTRILSPPTDNQQTRPLLIQHHHQQAQQAIVNVQQQQQQQQQQSISRLEPPRVGDAQQLFRPHPNAPAPNPLVVSGQRVSTYGMPPVHETQPVQGQTTFPESTSLLEMMRMASTPKFAPNGAMRMQTLFGKTVIELSNAHGPVPIMWSLEPFPPPMKSVGPGPAKGVIKRAATTTTTTMTTGMGSPLGMTVQSVPGGVHNTDGGMISRTASPVAATATRGGGGGGPGDDKTSIRSSQTSVAIPRANFFPKVGVPRPRSRSFSGFSSAVGASEISGGNTVGGDGVGRSSEEGNGSRPSSLRASTSSNGIGPLRQMSAPSPGVNGRASSSHSPSPLSLPHNNTVVPPTRSLSGGSGIKPPLSPLSQPPMSPPPPPEPQSVVSPSSGKPPRKFGLRQVASSITLRSSRSASPAPVTVTTPTTASSGVNPAAPVPVVTATPPTPFPVRRDSTPATPPPPPASEEVLVKEKETGSSSRMSRTVSSSTKHTRTVSGQSRASTRISTSQDDVSDTHSSMASPSPVTQSPVSSSPMQRASSLRTKLSLSTLKFRQSSKDETQMQASPSTTTTSTTVMSQVLDESGYPKETIHVKDIDFELVSPNTVRRMSSERTSYESMSRDGRPSIQRDSRSESPATFASSVVAISRSPIPVSVNESSADSIRSAKVVEDANAIEAHRIRESKWMNALSTIPSSQARKNKKVRKLVLEGVPSSVRYRVWAYLMDTESKRTPGVYGQLSKRGKVAVTDVIEKDAQMCFVEHAHLRDPKGPLVTLLQTYFTMVPDIEYQTSLAILAGHLLLFSPEEDAFWTFLSMMDTHLRPYFSPRAVQMDVDAQLFAKVVESSNPALAKKLFTDLDIAPIDLCRMWFSSAFATVLPPEYVNRMWDVYLCDGPPFFFRVGLAILTCANHIIGSFQFRSQAMSFLSRPPSSLLPPDPDAFVTMCLTVKLKDDDIRKQRVKMETQLKRENQASQNHQPLHPRNGPTPTISLIR